VESFSAKMKRKSVQDCGQLSWQPTSGVKTPLLQAGNYHFSLIKITM